MLGCVAESKDSATKDAEPSGEEQGASQGDLLFRFAMDVDYMAEMQEVAAGAFHGSIYLGEEVSSIGPEDGAQALQHIFVEDVVLPTDGSPTEVLIEIKDLPASEVVVLGFFAVMP